MLQKISCFAVAAVCVFLFSVASFAVDRGDLFRGHRVNGMGGAFTAVADDENAFFYNPAGITQRQGSLMQIFTIDTQISDLSFFRDNFSKISDFNTLSPAEQANILSQIPSIGFGFPNIAYISAPIAVDDNFISFGLGFFSFGSLDFAFEHALPTKIMMDLDITGTLVFAAPIAYHITNLEAISLPGSLSAGVNLKYINRYRGHLHMDTADFEDSMIREDVFAGKGFGADLGVIYSFTDEITFGMQIRDFFGTKIKYESASVSTSAWSYSNYTEKIDPTFNIGVSYVPKTILGLETYNGLTLAFDLRDIGSDSYPDGDAFDKVHAGAEYRWKAIALRIGLNSGRFATGFGIETNGFQLAYSYFGEPTYTSTETAWVNQFTLSWKLGHHKGRPFGEDALEY